MTIDHLYPRFHLRTPAGFVNDPNGPVVVDGRVHIYHQYRSALEGSSPVSWAHASSEDLVRWSYHRPAIAPQPGSLDTDGAWSGNTVAHDGIITAFYSGFIARKDYQSVLAADSYDSGYSFGPPRLVIDDPPPEEGIHTYRDPFVWKTRDGWALVVGAGGPGELAAARLFVSEDLQTWERQGDLASLKRQEIDGVDTGEMWECPQVLVLDGNTVVFVSPWTRSGGATQVLTVSGTTDDVMRVSQPDIRRYDHGSNFYAVSALPESAEGPLLWGWATEGRDASWAAEEGWGGMLSLPRRIALASDGRVLSAPLEALASLRTGEIAIRDHCVFDMVPAQFEFAVRLSSKGGTASVTLRFSETECLVIEVDRAERTVIIDRASASDDPRVDRGRSVVPSARVHADAQEFEVRGWVDGSVLEVFTGDGSVATTRFYPTAAPPWSVECEAFESEDEIRIWDLSSHDPAIV